MSDPRFPADWRLHELDARIRGIARRHVPGPDEDDLVQDVWLELIRHPPSDSAGLGGWVRLALIHAASRRRRKDRNRVDRERQVHHRVQAPSAADEVTLAEACVQLRALIESLDGKYGTALKLRYLDGLSIDEIGQRLRTNRSTVRTRIKRGLKALKVKLDDRDDGASRFFAGMALLSLLDRRVALPVDGLDPVNPAPPAGAAPRPRLVLAATLVGAAALFLVVASTAPGPSPAYPARGFVVATAGTPPVDRVELDSEPPEVGARSTGHVTETVAGNGRGPSLAFVERGTGDPVQGMPVSLGRGVHEQVVRPEHWKVTDAEGRIDLSGLEAGPWWIHPAKGTARQHDLRAGGVLPAVVEVDMGHRLEFSVIDRDGRGVAGADVELVLPGTRSHSRLLGKTDARGFFGVYDIADAAWIRVVAADFNPSTPVAAGDLRAYRRLVLREPIQPISGRIVGPTGEAVPGAKVCLLDGVDRVGNWIQVGRGRVLPVDITETQADEEGRFSFGRQNEQIATVLAWHPEVGALRTPYSATKRAAQDIELLLEPFASVQGRILWEGRPAAGVLVTLQQGMGLPALQTRSDELGNFGFECAAPGRATLIALDDQTSTSCGFELEPGRVREVGNLELSNDGCIKGRVSSAGAVPVGWTVRVTFKDLTECGIAPDLPKWMVEARTTRIDADGTFTLAACPELPGTLELLGPLGQRWRSDAPVRPGPDWIRIELPEALGRPGELAGGLTALGPYAGHPVRLVARSPHLVDPLEVAPDAGGRFVLPELPAGRAALEVRAGPVGTWPLGTFDVAPGQRSDVGWLALPEPGSLLVELDPEFAHRDTVLRFIGPSGRYVACVLDPVAGLDVLSDGAIRLAGILPGERLVRVRVPGAAQASRMVAIRPGETSILRPDLKRGVELDVRIELPSMDEAAHWHLDVTHVDRPNESTRLPVGLPDPGRAPLREAVVKTRAGEHAFTLLKDWEPVASTSVLVPDTPVYEIDCAFELTDEWTIRLTVP